jgi:hypothetical protein
LANPCGIAPDGSDAVSGIGRATNEAGDSDLGKIEFIARAESSDLGLRPRAPGTTLVFERAAIKAIATMLRSACEKVS